MMNHQSQLSGWRTEIKDGFGLPRPTAFSPSRGDGQDKEEAL